MQRRHASGAPLKSVYQLLEEREPEPVER
jgi:hypothetical protein